MGDKVVSSFKGVFKVPILTRVLDSSGKKKTPNICKFKFLAECAKTVMNK